MRKKNGQSGKRSLFCCVGSSCEGVDSDHWPSLKCELCMNIDVCFFVCVCVCVCVIRVKTTFLLTLTIPISIWTFLAYVWLEIWKKITYSKCKMGSLL